jgi:hypothetical protein
VTAVHERYTREMHHQYGYFACWLPNLRIALGDVGVLTGNRFEKVTTLAELGVAHTAGEPGEPADLEYSSAGQVEVTVDGKLDIPSTPDGGLGATLSITFTREGATFFQASRCVWETMAGLPVLERDLRRLRDVGTWRMGYVVVTSVLRTGPAVVVVSDRKGAKLDLRAGTHFPIGPLPVASAASGLKVVARSGLAASVIAPDGATPLFGAAGLRHTVTGVPRLVFRSGDTPDIALTQATWDDFTTGYGAAR